MSRDQYRLMSGNHADNEGKAKTMDKYEQAARALGWTRDGDGDGIIYNTNDYESWKAAVSWSPADGSIYDSWQECCEMESIEVQS